MTLDELIALLERAEGAQAALDFAIFKYLGWRDCDYYWDRDGERYEKSGPPNYTSSIDAALTLVPEGAFWGVDNDCPGSKDPPWHVAWCHGESAEHQSPAIALCIAALRARKEQP